LLEKYLVPPRLLAGKLPLDPLARLLEKYLLIPSLAEERPLDPLARLRERAREKGGF